MGAISTRADKFVQRVLHTQPMQLAPEKPASEIEPQRQARDNIMNELAQRRRALLARRRGL